MFTGIVREVGRVLSAESLPGGGRELRIGAPALSERLEAGSSVAVDGACLTATDVSATSFAVQIVGTTLSRTIAGGYAPEDRVNLEPSLTPSTPLDGHLVQGHVDGVGHLLERSEEGDHLLLAVRIPHAVGALTVLHGSIALNGVSLTVNALPSTELVEVALIPFTRSHTNLGSLKAGDPVNVEGDLVGKYVGRLMSVRKGRSPEAPGRPEAEREDG